MISGVLTLAPAIACHMLGLLAVGFVVAVKQLGHLARGNVTRNPRRTANTARALMIGMALLGAASVLAAPATASTQSIVEKGWIADFSLQSATQTVPEGVVADIRGLDTVDHVDILQYGPAIVARTPGCQPRTIADGPWAMT